LQRRSDYRRAAAPTTEADDLVNPIDQIVR